MSLSTMDEYQVEAWLERAVPTLGPVLVAKLAEQHIDGAFLCKHRARGDLIEMLQTIQVPLGRASAIDTVVGHRIVSEK